MHPKAQVTRHHPSNSPAPAIEIAFPLLHAPKARQSGRVAKQHAGVVFYAASQPARRAPAAPPAATLAHAARRGARAAAPAATRLPAAAPRAVRPPPGGGARAMAAPQAPPPPLPLGPPQQEQHTKASVLALLEAAGVPFDCHEHGHVMTCEAQVGGARSFAAPLPGARTAGAGSAGGAAVG
jgi:hypothetical protein